MNRRKESMRTILFLLDRSIFTVCSTFLFWFLTWFFGVILVGVGWFQTSMLFEFYGFAIGLVYGLYVVKKSWIEKDYLMADVLLSSIRI